MRLEIVIGRKPLSPQCESHHISTYTMKSIRVWNKPRQGQVDISGKGEGFLNIGSKSAGLVRLSHGLPLITEAPMAVTHSHPHGNKQGSSRGLVHGKTERRGLLGLQKSPVVSAGTLAFPAVGSTLLVHVKMTAVKPLRLPLPHAGAGHRVVTGTGTHVMALSLGSCAGAYPVRGHVIEVLGEPSFGLFNPIPTRVSWARGVLEVDLGLWRWFKLRSAELFMNLLLCAGSELAPLRLHGTGGMPRGLGVWFRFGCLVGTHALFRKQTGNHHGNCIEK
mmetsp:Transcript_1424/g.2696  ORF Transcript_1424/g.2696 Transcript_1424/m.2696 type:complete len:277 (+) Transcript_1424:432-1262(+)